jgi:hypothetical protein
MRNISVGNTLRGAAVAALTCSGLAGCGQHENASSGTGVGTTYEELAVQLQNCASNALDCVKAANCDDTAEQACRDEFHTCREATRDAYHAFCASVKDCFASARECAGGVRDSGAADADGGVRAAYGACRDQFKMCVDENRPIRAPAGPCMQGLRDCVQGGTTDRGTCFEQAHTCFVNRLPMCGPNTPGGGTGGGGAAGMGAGTGGAAAPGTGGAAAPGTGGSGI